MKFLSFKGGTHPHDNKEHTADKPIQNLTPSKIMVYPLSQHIGAPCEPLVKKGDRVLMGQKIGESSAFVSVPVHSTVSGTVIAVEPRLHPNGTKVMSVVVENDFSDELVDTIHKYDDTETLTKSEKLDIIKEAGIVGHGGATFPVHIKLNPPADKKID
ncbi:MAG: electron transport complex subunit RsxC, partial [Clostridia bacterium]|nr:electron transport complex subunit RsxC [Clostridia bacterium]